MTRPSLWRSMLLAACLLGTSCVWAFDVPELMALMSQRTSGEARFTEQRFVRGIDGPLEASGTLSFAAPDKLERRTLTPRPESMRVEGNTLTLSRGGRTRVVALDSMPELLGMIEAMRATLGGDARLLEKHFLSRLGGNAGQWDLRLEPLDERLAAQVRNVRLQGRRGDVLSVEMEFIGGDRSAMTITPVR